MPNGRRLKASQPNGVMKVVYNLDSSQRGNCQKMLFASSLVKILLFPNAARPSSTDIMGYICRRTAWLSFVRNTQILTRLA